MIKIDLNGKPAVKVKADLVAQTRGAKSSYRMKCKGGERWFSKSTVNIHFNGTMDIHEWLYKKIIKETPDFFELAEAEDTKN